MRLRVPSVVLEVVNIIGVPRPIDFHRLQELHEFSETRLSVDTKDVSEGYGASIEVTEANDEQVDQILEQRELFPMRLHRANQAHAESLW